MHGSRTIMALLSPAALVGIGLVCSPALAQSYNVTDLGTFSPVAINATGTVAGNMGMSAAIWTPTASNGGVGTTLSLGTLSGQTSSAAHGINDSGTVVGTASGTTNDQAFTWSISAGMTPVAVPSDSPNSYGYAINNSGLVAGTAGDIRLNYSGNNTLLHAFSSGAAGVQDLGTLTPPSGDEGVPPTSTAWGLNDAGEAVGTTTYLVYTSNGYGGDVPVNRACYWTPDGTVVSLNLPPDPSSAHGYSNASVINNAGQIIGSYTVSGSGVPASTTSFVWAPGTGPQYLSSPVSQYSGATAINDNGVMVGGANLGGSQFDPLFHALIYQGTVGADLNTMIDPTSGWTLNTTIGINNSGEIIGMGTRVINGLTVKHGFLLTPTPEPSSAAALAAGSLVLAGLILRARRRRSARAKMAA